jgi:antitoxin component of MazEF toxin-antitoxin module
MIKRLTAVGNSLAVLIDRPIRDLLGIDRETLLEVTTDGTALVIRPLVRTPDVAVAPAPVAPTRRSLGGFID